MNRCPQNCSGSNSARQHELTEGQFRRVSASAKAVVAELKCHAYRCSYCGCVYMNELSNTRILGSLDNSILGEGWHSKNYP